MKKQLKKAIAAFLTLSMIIVLLPAHIALATDEEDMSNHVKYGTLDKLLADATFQGHVLTLTEASETNKSKYDYMISVGVYNMDAAINYHMDLSYNTEDVTWVRPNGNDQSTATAMTQRLTIGKVTADMISEAAANYTEEDDGIVYLNQNLSPTLFSRWDYRLDENVDSTSRNELFISTQISNALSSTDWTNENTGANYSEVGGFKVYKFPTNQVVTLYTMYFKLNEGVSSLKSDTFAMAYEATNGFNGSVGLRQTTTVGDYYWQNEQTYLIGFPEPQIEDQAVEFTQVTNSTGAGINGATIKIFSDAALTQEVTAAGGVTANNGTIDGYYKSGTVLTANTRYYYTVSLAGYVDETGYFDVGSTTAQVSAITLKTEAEATYNATITVKDADTGAALTGAAVLVGGTLAGTTDSYGQVTGQFTSGTHALSASLEGYTMPSPAPTLTVSKTGTNAATISLVPVRASVTLPAITDGSESVSGATVTVTRTTTTSPVNGWSTTNTKTYNSGETLDLPTGNDYTLTIAAAGYASKTVYLRVASDGTPTYYSDSTYTDTVTTPDVTITKLEDPYYQVDVTQDDDDKTKFTATVTLNNIAGTFGTFGLKYDKDVFDFGTFTPESSSEIGLFNPDPDAPENANVEIKSGDDETTGYHVFSWQSLNNAVGEPFDATAGKTVVTYTFTLKNGKSVNDITSDAFSVMPYDKTSAGIAYIAAAADISEAREYLDSLWRYTDSENTEDNLGTGRLEESKATLNGFNQVFVNSTDGTEDADCTFDVMTYVNYTNFDAAKAALNFIVTDEDNVPLNNASVKLYDSEDNAITTLTTDSTGIASYAVSGSATYKYSVSCTGYWDEPETGLNTVTVPDKTTTNEYIALEQKIYHETELQNSTGSAITDAMLSGDKYAYTGRDYHFNIAPNPGKKLDPDTNLSFVAVVEGQICPVTYESASNTYVLAAQYVTGDPTSDTPDMNGFPSEGIIIKMISGSIIDSDETYTVTAHAGTNGTVTYDPNSTSYNEDAGSTTSDITVSDITPDEGIGKFTFTAESGYKVEKVIVNGVQIHDYDNETEFIYDKFTNITMDSDITVTFWDGVNPSTDAVVTLVVGSNGKAEVTNPTPEATVSNTRKTYIYTGAGSLDFTLTPDGGHSVNSVEKSVNGGENETVSGTPYSVPVAEGDVTTVYVTFDTSTVFVNAYVKSGEGTISPVGVLILNMYDSPTFVMEAKDSDWAASAVDVNGTVVNNSVSNDQTFTYTVHGITNDTSVGAIFTETSYKVTGHVDLSQGKNLTSIAVISPAIVTCTRPSDGMTVTVQTTKSRTDATFDAPLPKGTWNITVSKVGYINYTITGFEVDGTSDVTFGKKSDESTQKITPYIGNTSGTGKTVSLTDAGVVSNGLRTAASAATKAKADVDDDGEVSATSDMAYIRYNYGQRSVTETYTDFLAH